MKKLLIIPHIFLFCSVQAQINMDSYGKVGIGGEPDYPSYNLQVDGDTRMVGTAAGTPTLLVKSLVTKNYPILSVYGSSTTYEFYVAGQSYSSSGWISSDEKYKMNISNLTGKDIIPKLMKINGKKYNFKGKDELKELCANGILKHSEDEIPNFPIGDCYGLLAQEIEIEFPELVKTDSITETKAINYDGMIPLLLTAIKEHQQTIETLQSNISALEKVLNSKSDKLKSAKQKNEINSPDEQTGNALYQNAPNPFSESTEIKFSIPQRNQSAMICIYNMNGIQLKCYNLQQSGTGSITINGSELQAGMYMYALIVDGKEVDTKRMILTN